MLVKDDVDLGDLNRYFFSLIVNLDGLMFYMEKTLRYHRWNF